MHTPLTDRAVIRLSGSERIDFLQNLVTQNVTGLPTGACVMTALLTPQGKMLHDFLIYAEEDCLLLDCDAATADALMKKLTLYKLRADVQLEMSALEVHALWQEDGYPCPPMEGFVEDPRHQGLGLRGFLSDAAALSLPKADLAAWHDNRLRLGVPQGPQDMPPGTVFPLEFGLQLMHAIDFQKGCFIGQEVTSRTHRKGSLRKKLHKVRLSASDLDIGADIMAGERIVGQLVAVRGDIGLALIREDALALNLQAQGHDISPRGGLFDESA